MSCPSLIYATSCSYNRLPLTYLCEKSEVIAVCMDESITVFKEREKKRLPENLNIMLVLKGDASTFIKYKDLQVVKSREPEKEGNIALIFLFETKGFMGCGFKGAVVKLIPSSELSVYIEKINQLLEILKERDTTNKNQQLVEWSVKCVEDPEPTIQCEGAHILFRCIDFQESLTEEQKERLIAALFNCVKGNQTEWYLMVTISKCDEVFALGYVTDIVSSSKELGVRELSLMWVISNIDGSKALLPYAIRYLESHLNDLPPNYEAGSWAMCLAIGLKKDDDCIKKAEFALISEFDELSKGKTSPLNEAKRKACLSSFIFLMKN